ncbi:MAG: thioredoxin family protein [Caldimonas sp.]
MNTRFTFRTIASLGAGLAFCLGVGAAELPYSKAAFEAAVAAGKPVVVDFKASWCPTCKAQKPIVDALLAEPKRKELTLFAADYDTEAALKQQLRVTQQSTFVVFKGGKEVGRSTGQTNRDAIAGLFDKAL